MSGNIVSVDHNGTVVNCSLYSLTQGSLVHNNRNMSISSSPAYFITNCSQAAIQHFLSHGGSEGGFFDSWEPQFDISDDGDAFVALIFTIGGTCITCWMLCVFLVLSPSHKRKPVLTQVSTVFNTIVLTILMSKATDASRDNYYSDTMNVVGIHNVFYANLTFRITNVFSEALILISFVQVISKIIQRKHKLAVMAFSSVLVLMYVVVGIVCEARYRNTINELVYFLDQSAYTAWHQAKNALKLVYVAWVSFLLFNYTFFIKSPRKYSHNKKLFPLALFIWTLFTIHFAVCILIVAVFQHSWQNRSWLSILPNIIEIGILSLVWEWIYDIRSLERRSELMGVLGRRISFEDVSIFQSDHGNKGDKNKSGKYKVFQWIKDRIYGYPMVNVYAESDNNLKLQSTSNTTSGNATLAVHNDNSNHNDSHDNNDNGSNNIGCNENNAAPNSDNAHNAHNAHNDSSLEYEVEYVDDYELFARPDLGPSNVNDDPPPFEPAPGFGRGDYWPDPKQP